MGIAAYELRELVNKVADAIAHVGDGLFAIAGAIERLNDGE